MNKIIYLVLLTVFSDCVYSQNSDILHKEKLKTIIYIIDEIKKSALKNQELIIWLDINYKDHSTVKGIAGTHIEYSTGYKADTILLKEIEQHYLQKKLKLSVRPNDLNTTRNSFLSEIRSDTNFHRKPFFLIETFSPLDGWNVLDFFYRDTSGGLSGTPYMDYYTNLVSIPVFVYTNDLNEEKKKWMLFSFEMVFENEKLFLKPKKMVEL